MVCVNIYTHIKGVTEGGLQLRVPVWKCTAGH